MSTTKKVWIDTDCGVDDAFALLTAMKLPEIEIVAMSAVCGNVEVEKTFKNTRNVCSLAGREDIKVYQGSDTPFEVDLECAYEVHGRDGLGGIWIKDSSAPIETKAASEALYECAKSLNGELYVVAVGPLTNIAATIAAYPDFVNYVKEIDLMGGSIAMGGNCNTTAEFNIHTDPHAAETVFRSGIKINMFPLDVTMKSILTKEEIAEIAKYDNKVCDFATKAAVVPMTLYKNLGLGEHLCLHDTCPLVYLAYPDVFKGQEAGVLVETRAKISFGRTVSDLYIHSDSMMKKNATIMLEVDRDRLADIVKKTFKEYSD